MTEVALGSTVDGRYVLRREVARGGMCIVYAAEHRFTGRTVALKFPRPEQAHDQSVRLRLLREAKATELSRHPCVVDMLDAATTPDGIPYLVMEMLEGRTLEGILTARRQLPVADAVSIARQICEGVGSAHAHGVIHRDLKPNNVMLVRTRSGEEAVKIIDFSIASLRGDQLEPNAPKITRHEELLGTPEYMAPEQLLLLPNVDPRCDLYSIAVTLFECLAGTVPHPGAYGQVIVGVTTQPIPSVRAIRQDVDVTLAAILQRGLARDPSERFADASDLIRSLLAACPAGARPSALLPTQRHPVTLQPLVPVEAPARSPEPPPLSIEQRRKYERQPYVTPARMSQGPLVLDGRTEDISEGGVLIILNRPCRAGERALVRFAAPLSGRVYEAAVLARWVRDAHGKTAVGAEFQSAPEELRVEIAQYVAFMGQAPKVSSR